MSKQSIRPCHPDDALASSDAFDLLALNDSIAPGYVSNQHAPSQSSSYMSLPEDLYADVRHVFMQDHHVDDETMSKRGQMRRGSRKPHSLLACPFWRLRPEQHISCLHSAIPGHRHLKQHLLLRHRPPEHYCSVCRRTFQTAIEVGEHVMQERGYACDKPTKYKPEILTNEQIMQLQDWRMPRGSRIEAGWYELWDICFPGRERPLEIYMEDTMAEVTKGSKLGFYRDFVSSQGLDILGDVLSESGYSDVDPREALLNIPQNGPGLDLIFSRWATIWEERAMVDREPPTIESVSSTSRWPGSTPAAAGAPGLLSPSADAPGSLDLSDLSDHGGGEAEWSPEEDSLLVELKGNGTARDDISDNLPNRSTQSCRRRYLHLYAKWSEELKRKLSAFRTTERCTEESKPCSNRWEQDTGTTINSAQVPPSTDTNSEGCLSTTQVASSIATPTPATDDMDTLSRDDSQSETHLDGSDESEYSMFDDAALYDSSRFSVLESAAADQLLDAYDRWSRISTFCNPSCTAFEPSDTSGASQTRNAASGSNASPPSPSPSVGISASVASPASQASPKVPSIQKRDREDGDSDDEKQPKKRMQKRKRVEEGTKRLACPFQKRYHPGHLFCGEDRATRGFQTIAQVKQHVGRSHLHPIIHCTRCKVKFSDVSELGRHNNATPHCEELPYFDETKLVWNENLVKAISSRVNVKIDMEKQWFSVWGLLFPGVKQPASCRVESDELCKHLLDLQQFVVDEGDGIVEEILLEDDSLLEAGEADQETEEIERRREERKSFGVRVLNLAAKRFVEGRAAPRGPDVARYRGHISPTNTDGAMTDPRVGVARLSQAPPAIQALDEADAQPETLLDSYLPQDEDGTLPAESWAISLAAAGEFDFSISGIHSPGNMVWDPNVSGQLDPEFGIGVVPLGGATTRVAANNGRCPKCNSSDNSGYDFNNACRCNNGCCAETQRPPGS